MLSHFIAHAREAELKRMDKDKELPVTVRLMCGGLAGAISQTGKTNSSFSHWIQKSLCVKNRRAVRSIDEAPVCQAGGCRFKPRPDQPSGS